MQRYWISLALFALFVVEGTLMEWLLPPVWQSRVLVSPHFVLVGVLFVALFQSRYQALAFGLAFGFLQDFIYYGHALGVHSFSMGLAGYAVGLAFRGTTRGIVASLFAVVFGTFGYDALVFGIYRLFLGVVRLDFQWTFLHQMLPSTLFNTLVALILYVPARKWLDAAEGNRETDEK